MAIVNKMDEQILVVPRTELFGANDEGAFQGFRKHFDHLLSVTPRVKRRGDVEEDETLKQLITYAIVRETETGRYLCYKRIGNGDARLQMKSSLGVGGHTNDEDLEDVELTLHINALREIHEELTIKNTSIDVEIIGFINDDSDAVGRVHLGVVYLVQVPKADDVQVAETDTLRADWMTKEEVLAEETLENWSKLIQCVL